MEKEDRWLIDYLFYRGKTFPSAHSKNPQLESLK
jgi:hypothetical protein